MKRFACIVVLGGCLVSAARAQNDGAGAADGRFWPQWRGPLATGVAPLADPPVVWGERNNVRWKLPLSGTGHSSPIVWDNLIFVTAAVPIGDEGEPVYSRAQGAHDNLPVRQNFQFVVTAVNRDTGRIAWQRTVHEARPQEGGHYTGSLASNSAVTDGSHVFASFGSHGLYCLNMAGNLIWQADFGAMRTRHAHGEGSSPALHGEILVVNWDHEGDSFIIALDKRTGMERWRRARDEMTSWSSPIIVTDSDPVQVIVSATNRIRGYDLATGRVVWECGGLSRNVVASPVADKGIVYVANSYDWQALLAIRYDGARGDVTGTDRIVWFLDRLTPYVPSPLLYDDRLYFLRHNQGILTAVDARTGEFTGGPYRLNGIRMVFASPVAAANRLYVTDRNGVTLVLKLGTEIELLALNQLDDGFSASPALVDKTLLLRGERYLYSLENQE